MRRTPESVVGYTAQSVRDSVSIRCPARVPATKDVGVEVFHLQFQPRNSS